MIRINYKKDLYDLEKNYLAKLFSTRYISATGITIKEKFDDLKKTYPYDAIFYDTSFDDIIFIKPNKILKLINKIELRIIEQSEIEYKTINKKKTFTYEVRNKLKELFDYENKFQPFISSFFEEKVQVKTCSFCNIHFVNEYKDKDESFKNEFTLDHYYDKATYPYLALSFYNLIPSCYTCNSKLKKNEEFKNLAPSSKDFDFDEKVKFKLYLDKSCENLHIKDKEHIDIELKEYYSNDYDKYIEVFKLNERYKAHKDIVYDMITKAELYPESRLKELQDLTGIPFQQIKKDIFNLIDENEDLSKKPFSKLIKDISEELGL